jgi:hypothetical protein
VQNHDVEAAAAKMSIDNIMDYEASDIGVDVLFNKEIAARSAFSKRVSKNARVGDLHKDYYGIQRRLRRRGVNYHCMRSSPQYT